MSMLAALRGTDSRAIKFAGRNPQDPRLAEFFSEYGPNPSGVEVNATTAMRLVVVYACIRLIMEDVAKVPLGVFKRTDDRGDKERLRNETDRLLNHRPNPEMTGPTFREVVTGWALRHGNGYAFIARNGAGRVSELWPIESDRVSIVRREDQAGIRHYLVDEQVVQPRNIFHLRMPGPDGLEGWSPIRMAREAIGAGLAAEQFQGSFFQNNSQGGGILRHPGKLSPEALQRLRDTWEQQYGGPRNAFRTKILEEGMDWASSSIPQQDAQFIEQRQFTVEEICRLYRVAPHKVQHLLRATFSNIEEQNLDHVTDTLMPWFVRWEREGERSVLTPQQRARGEFLEHIVADLLRGKMQDQAEFYSQLFAVGAMSQNDIRRKLDENSIGGEGDTYYVPMNMERAMTVAELKKRDEDEKKAEADKAKAQADAAKAQASNDSPGDKQGADGLSDSVRAGVVELVQRTCQRLRRIEADRSKRRPDFARSDDHLEAVSLAYTAVVSSAAKMLGAEQIVATRAACAAVDCHRNGGDPHAVAAAVADTLEV